MAATIGSKIHPVEQILTILNNHKEGGRKAAKEELLEEQEINIQKFKEEIGQNLTIQSAVDSISQENICDQKDINKLSEITLNDLSPGEI